MLDRSGARSLCGSSDPIQLIRLSVSFPMSSSGYYRKRGSASYIVREVRSVREREIYRERERERVSE